MYNQKMVASIKVKGKILREIKENVLLPFGCEYSILLKNLNTVRCVVNVFIDGDNVVPGGIVLSPNQTVDLERSIKNGNLTEGNKFKFIERTSAIEDGPRGIKLEDGIIRVEYQFEKYAAAQYVINQQWVPGHYEYNKQMLTNNPYYGPFIGGVGASGSMGTVNQVNVGGTMRSVDTSLNGAKMQAQASSAVNKYCADNHIGGISEMHDGAACMDWNDVGITVPGSKSTQQFQTATVGLLETEKYTIVLKLLGETADNKPVAKPVTVKAKPKCVTCGTTNKATSHFCSKCGTSLEIFA